MFEGSHCDVEGGVDRQEVLLQSQHRQAADAEESVQAVGARKGVLGKTPRNGVLGAEHKLPQRGGR